MADPTKVPNNPDPNNIRGRNAVEPNGGKVIRNRRSNPWAWIVAIIVILLIIWAFFRWNDRARVVSPATPPATAASTIR